MIAVSNGKIKIGVYDMKPIRKKPCLCVADEKGITKFASFNNEETAELFMKILADFVGARESDEE